MASVVGVVGVAAVVVADVAAAVAVAAAAGMAGAADLSAKPTTEPAQGIPAPTGNINNTANASSVNCTHTGESLWTSVTPGCN